MTATPISERYGNSRRSRVVVIVVLAIVGTVAAAWLAWVISYYARPLTQSGLSTFDIVSEHRAIANVTVTRRDTTVTAKCLLRAYAEDHTPVGELNFEVTATEPKRVELIKSVRTERRATSIELVGCTADGQSRRR